MVLRLPELDRGQDQISLAQGLDSICASEERQVQDHVILAQGLVNAERCWRSERCFEKVEVEEFGPSSLDEKSTPLSVPDDAEQGTLSAT